MISSYIAYLMAQEHQDEIRQAVAHRRFVKEVQREMAAAKEKTREEQPDRRQESRTFRRRWV